MNNLTEQPVYHLTLADGTIVGPLTKNGTCFVSSTPLNINMFEDNLAPVIISDGVEEEVHDHMGHPAISSSEDDSTGEEIWYLSLWDLSEEELKYAKLRSDIDYLAMMTETDM